MSARNRALIGIAIVAALIVAVVMWKSGRRSSGPAGTSGKGTGSGGAVTVQHRGAKDPLTGVPRWLGQTNVKGRRIAGIVVGEDGKPVTGATVRLVTNFTAAGLVPVPSKATDGSGRFDFGVQPATSYLVTAESPKLTAAFLGIDLRDPFAKSEHMKLMLHACRAALHGTIFDAAGGAIGGAFVARSSQGLAMATPVGVLADDAGNYELCVPAGGASISVSADGYASTLDHADIYGRTRRDYQLMPGTSVVGRVVRASDRSPVEGAIIELRPEDVRDGILPLWTSSDADGKFHFDAVAPGRHLATARADRLMTAQPVEVLAEVGTTGGEHVIELAATYSVTGKVVEIGKDAPVAGVTVTLVPRVQARWESQRTPSARSQADGTFVIEHVLPAKYRATVGHDDEGSSKPDEIDVATSDVSGIVLEYGARATIAGRVLYENKPVDGALVRGGQTSTYSDADGAFVLRGVDDGTIQLYAESHLVGAFTQGPKVTVAAGEEKAGVDIVLDLSASIAGVVVDQNDAPVAGASLRFSLVRGRDFGAATTATDGTFTARSMSGGGDYVYEVRQRDGSAIIYPPVTGKRHPPIAVKDGATHVTGVRVKVRVEKLAIAGKVADATGKPVADVVVQAVPRDGRWYRLPTATSDQAGAFKLVDLPAGDYTVQAKAARGEASVENVAAGRMDLALQLLDPGGIDVTVKGFSGTTVDVSAFRMGERSFSRFTAKLVGSVYQLRGLPVGRYQVQATDGTDRKGSAVEVRSGGVATVTLTVGEIGTVEGRVVDASGTPIAGMTCMAQQRGGDDYGYGGRPEARTDVSGAFRIERAAAGGSIVGCYNQDGVTAWKQVEVAAGQVIRVELTAEKRSGRRQPDKDGRSGLTLEEQLEDVIVSTVVPNSPAAQAGILVDDVIHSVDSQVIGRGQSWLALRGIENGNDTVKVVIERNDKQVTVQITYASAASGSASPAP